MIFDKQNPTLNSVYEGLDKRLTFLENHRCTEVEVEDTGDADVEFEVEHNLGKTPRLYLYNISQSGIVYDSRRAEWTTSLMYLKCSSANAELILIVT